SDAIRRDRPRLEVLALRRDLGLPVDRRGRREYDARYTRIACRDQEPESCRRHRCVSPLRVLDRPRHGWDRCEMKDPFCAGNDLWKCGEEQTTAKELTSCRTALDLTDVGVSLADDFRKAGCA